MTDERQKAINEWLDIHCKTCENNLDAGTEHVNCQAECEVQKDVGVACIHYEYNYEMSEFDKECAFELDCQAQEDEIIREFEESSNMLEDNRG